MSTLVAQTISNGSVSTSSANVIRGSARVWVVYNSTSQTILGSYNVSSVTFNGTGTFTVNFTNAFSNTNYATLATTARGDNANGTAMIALGTNATTSIQVKCVVSSSTLFNDGYNSVACFGT